MSTQYKPAHPNPVTYRAAGGIVVDGARMLLLDRPARNEVRLPKGHIETGETDAMAALRETIEETGYADLAIVADLGEQTVEFEYKGRHIIRHEHYFLMRLESQRKIARTEEDEAQFRVQWATWEEACALLTYAAEQEMARRAVHKLQSAS